MPHFHRFALTIAVSLSLLAGCGGADSPESASSDPTSTTPPSTTSAPAESTTTEVVDYSTALENRLASEWDDESLATEIVSSLPADSLAAWEAKVPLGDVAADPRLTYRPETVDDSNIDSLIGFTFGYQGTDTERIPGPVNTALADAVQRFTTEYSVPVYAQTTVAKLLTDAGVPNVTSLDAEIGDDGNLVYLSTAGAAELAISKAEAAGMPLGLVGVVGFSDHLGRCLLTAQDVGLDAAVPAGLVLPTEYDPDSSQPWTRNRLDYLTTDLAARSAFD